MFWFKLLLPSYSLLFLPFSWSTSVFCYFYSASWRFQAFLLQLHLLVLEIELLLNYLRIIDIKERQKESFSYTRIVCKRGEFEYCLNLVVGEKCIERVVLFMHFVLYVMLGKGVLHLRLRFYSVLPNEVEDTWSEEGEQVKVSELAVYTLNLSRCHMLDAREFFHSYIYVYFSYSRIFARLFHSLLFIERPKPSWACVCMNLVLDLYFWRWMMFFYSKRCIA